MAWVQGHADSSSLFRDLSRRTYVTLGTLLASIPTLVDHLNTNYVIYQASVRLRYDQATAAFNRACMNKWSELTDNIAIALDRGGDCASCVCEQGFPVYF